jgi:biopolymer transport protein ExbD
MIARATESDDEPLAQINITPLVDVMLVMLAIFLVVAPLLTHAVRVELPKAAVVAAPRDHAVTLALDARGRLYIDGRETTFAQLELVLERLASQDPHGGVNLQSDRRESFGDVAKVVALIERAGIVHVAIATADDEEARDGTR